MTETAERGALNTGRVRQKTQSRPPRPPSSAQTAEKSEALPDKFDFVQVKTRRVFEEIILQIRRELTLGNLRPGDKLPAERELAKQFGTSRTAVREALRTLENAGIVISYKGVKGGAFIRETEPGLLTQLLGDMVNLGSISLESLTEARVHILTLVAELAGSGAQEEHLAGMAVAIEEAERHTMVMDAQRRQDAIGAFYDCLARATGNEVMVMLVRSITEIVRAVLLEVAPLPKSDTPATLRLIVAALRQRDGPGASRLMREHLRDLHLHLLQARNAARPSVLCRRQA